MRKLATGNSAQVPWAAWALGFGLVMGACASGGDSAHDTGPGDVPGDVDGGVGEDAGLPEEIAEEDGTATDPGDDAGDAGDDGGPDGGCVGDGECDDGVLCTVDTCGSDGLCRHEAQSAICDDGAPCTGTERCDPSAGCLPGEPVLCDDGVSCTLDACEPMTGACRSVVDESFCIPPMLCNPTVGCVTPPECDGDDDCLDTNVCNGVERCGPAGMCEFGTPLVCDDGIPCTIDACEPATGCVVRRLDRDGDTYPDAACGGNDCDDGNADVHPGATEVCNAADDDCDELIDETFVCTPGASGRCTTASGCAGTWTCGADCSWGRCIVTATESCNGADDDCDTLVDEDYGCALGSAEACPMGMCTGVRTCGPGCTWGACLVSTTESCNGLDDDCDGSADEGFACTLGAGRVCTVATCAGTQSCGPGCTWGACLATAPEICNGLDDDCDGAVDETFGCALGTSRPCSVASCSGVQSCDAACSWGSCSITSTESCNGLDDDCDGVIDDGFACAAGSTRSCTNSCGNPAAQVCGVPGCTWGTCCSGSEVCGNGCDDDCNGTPDDGCTAICNTAAARVLIYGPGGTSSQPYFPAGTTVTVADETTWRGMSTTDFGQYDVIWIDGGNCDNSGTFFVAARDTQATWGPAVRGRRLIAVGDADYHATYGSGDAQRFIANSVSWLKELGRNAAGGSTSLYFSWGCTLFTPGSVVVPSDMTAALGSPFVHENINCEADPVPTAFGATHPVLAGVGFAWGCIPHGVLTGFPTGTYVSLSYSSVESHVWLLSHEMSCL